MIKTNMKPFRPGYFPSVLVADENASAKRHCSGDGLTLLSGAMPFIRKLYFILPAVLLSGWTAVLPISVAQAAFALCPSGEMRIFVPASGDGQLSCIYDLARTAGQEKLDLSFVTQPLPGRGGSYATSRLLDEKGDGCFLAAVQLPSFLFLAESPDRMYRAGDIVLAGIFASLPNALWVADDSPFQTPADLVNYARTLNETPDGNFTLAGVGSYTDQHLATLQFNRAAGVQSIYRPMAGSAEAAAAVLKGDAAACWGYALAPDSMPGMRALAVAAPKRSTALPGVPTLYEAKIDMENISVFGLGMTAAASEKKQAQVGAALETIFTGERFQEELAALGATPLQVPFDRLRVYLGNWRGLVRKIHEQYSLIPGSPYR